MIAGLALAIGLTTVVVLAWIAGEMHYRNCVEARVAEQAAALANEKAALPDLPIDARPLSLAGCSRWP